MDAINISELNLIGVGLESVTIMRSVKLLQTLGKFETTKKTN